jgi:hypothetical protein
MRQKNLPVDLVGFLKTKQSLGESNYIDMNTASSVKKVIYSLSGAPSVLSH